jgi:hypothetical protein
LAFFSQGSRRFVRLNSASSPLYWLFHEESTRREFHR